MGTTRAANAAVDSSSKMMMAARGLTVQRESESRDTDMSAVNSLSAAPCIWCVKPPTVSTRSSGRTCTTLNDSEVFQKAKGVKP